MRLRRPAWFSIVRISTFGRTPSTAEPTSWTVTRACRAASRARWTAAALDQPFQGLGVAINPIAFARAVDEQFPRYQLAAFPIAGAQLKRGRLLDDLEFRDHLIGLAAGLHDLAVRPHGAD